MNKNYVICMCDESHSWKIEKSRSELTDKEMICPYKHDAVTIEEFVFIDDVVVTFWPAGSMKPYDPKKQVHDRGKYYIIISNIDGTESKTSKQCYWWKEAVEIAQRFDKRSFQEGLKFWEMWKL